MSVRAEAQDRTCSGGEPARGVIVAVDGTVTGQDRAGQPIPVSVGAPLCGRDRITTADRSRIEFRLAGKDTTTGSSGNSVTVIPDATSACVELAGGTLSFISSVFGTHCIRTPLLDAGIDGTEALVVVDAATGDSFVMVREGTVVVRDRRSSANVVELAAAPGADRPAAFATKSQTAIRATPDNVPAKFRSILLRPDNATDWAVYFPPILLASGIGNGDVTRAAALLDGGEPEAADRLLAGLAVGGQDKAAALALRAIAAIYRDNVAEGTAFADEAVATAPGLAAAYVAQSYARQAGGKLNAAEDSARAATEADPANAYAWARLAELRMTSGDHRGAANAAERSLFLQETALGRTMEGFVNLAAKNFAAADRAFNRAIELDSEAPLTRLGLGLSAIRQGDAAKGRLELETAVALDPRRASLRVWLGRAYLEEGRSDKAASQLALAQAEDPDDPNAFLFDALRLYQDNRPIEALRAVEAARAVSDGRSVVRSTRGLGEDRAVQGAALGRIYDVLGLEQRALSEGAKAIDADPANPEAHRFLADIFRAQSNAEIAQASQTLKADLLAPPSKAPIQLQLAETDLALLDTAGPARITFSEFAPAFDSNGLRLDLSGILGSIGDEFSASVLYDNVSLSVGQLYYETDGYRVNNDLEHQVYDIQLKLAPVDGVTLFAEYRQRRTVAGDRNLDFFLNTGVDPTLRQELERDFFRVGVHGEPGPNTDLLGVATFGNLRTYDSFMGAVTTDTAQTEDETVHLQVQGIHQFENAKLILGGSFARTDVMTSNMLTLPGLVLPPPLPFLPPIVLPPITVNPTTNRQINQYGAYAYLTTSPLDEVEITLGGSYDYYDDKNGIGRRTSFNPKGGIRITLDEGIQVRAAFARTLNPRLVSNQLLEPTSVMGFPQYLDILNGAMLEMAGVAVDADLTDTVKAGAQAVFHRWDNPVTGTSQRPETRDMIFSGYVQKTFGTRWSASAGFYHESAESDALFDLDDFRLTSFPISVRYFDPLGLFGAVEVEPGFHSFANSAFTTQPSRGSENFVMVNASIGYRLPNGMGVLSLEAQNLLDQDINFQDRTSVRDIFAVPRFAPDLTLFARATIRFDDPMDW